jgi:hypothetical protein|tara:strand:+ start:5531 stop:5707 length:177 start_codon:yes stop_codon:yes gene_type:complete
MKSGFKKMPKKGCDKGMPKLKDGGKVPGKSKPKLMHGGKVPYKKGGEVSGKGKPAKNW